MSVHAPNKHHYIPEFYLANWTGDDRRFERYDKKQERFIRNRFGRALKAPLLRM